ncbi:HAD family hydrolase [Methylobacterium phyllosphaerae]
MIRAVVFDMDGVLIDAKDWHYEALNRALQHFGMEISRADHLTTFDGLPTRRKLEMLTVTENLPVELHGFLNKLKQIYTLEIVSTRCRPTFAHEFALSRLKARGLRLAVASNSVRDTVAIMMERANLARHLDLTLSNEDVARAKPDPEIYTTAIARLGVRPEETLIVEDNEHGIRAARASGCHLLVVRSVADVTLSNIDRRIAEIEAQAA